MTPLGEILPPNFSRWNIEVLNILGECKVIARRNGITFILACDTQGWWHIQKLKGGRVLASKTTKRLPAEVAAAIHRKGGRWYGSKQRQRAERQPA